MTEPQAAALVAMLATTFDTPAWEPERMELFTAVMADLDYDTAKTAVMEYVRTAQRRPVPADIVNACRRVMERRGVIPADLDPDQAWGFVWQCVRTIGGRKPFPGTHPAVKATIDRMGWEALCGSPEGSSNVIRAQFDRLYRLELHRCQEARNTAPGLRLPDDRQRVDLIQDRRLQLQDRLEC